MGSIGVAKEAGINISGVKGLAGRGICSVKGLDGRSVCDVKGLDGRGVCGGTSVFTRSTGVEGQFRAQVGGAKLFSDASFGAIT